MNPKGSVPSRRHRLALPPGFRLRHYRIEDQLGFGSFGITYLAQDETLGRPVAIKELLPTLIASRFDTSQVGPNSSDEEPEWAWAQERFLEEARVLARCEHPNILRVYETFRENGTAYMVMRYERGCTLKQWLAGLGRAPTEAELRKISDAILSGLAVVHRHGFLHRDIKPDNIYMAEVERPILIDFGSARQVVVNRSVPMTAIVTEGYAPFEQYTNGGRQGPWTDLYALAAVLYYAITKQAPPTAVVRASTRDQDPCLRLAHSHAGQYSAAFLRTVDAALQCREEDRPQSVEEWQARLARKPVELKGPERSRTSLLVVAAALLLLLAAGAAVLLERQRKPQVLTAEGRATPEPVPPSATPTPSREIAIPEAPRPVPPTPVTLTEIRRELPPASLLSATPLPIPEVPRRPSLPEAPALPQASKSEPFVNSLGMKFVPIGGAPILFSVWETRVKDYEAFVNATARGWARPPFAQQPTHAAVRVSWTDATAFCTWLTERERVSGALPGTAAYRLPGDLEWSRAAGLGPEYGDTPALRDSAMPGYVWGDQWPPPKGAGNFDVSLHMDAFAYTSPVGSFPPNRYGLYDLAGNAWEWVNDWFDETKTKRTVRGGSWADGEDSVMASIRFASPPDAHNKSYGFRVVIAGGSAAGRAEITRPAYPSATLATITN